MKQTVKVVQILEWANNQLARKDESATEEFKQGICTMIERILLDADQYNGYTYLNYNSSEWSRTYWMRKKTLAKL